ncbi:amidohydrolase family protein [Streptomyces sp. NPDC096311]|uniref:amidohydrolase family protein n=1 Tax=Streptomyces sp. NPDC096311 TaxID=3366083 RepID=UPI0038211CBC
MRVIGLEEHYMSEVIWDANGDHPLKRLTSPETQRRLHDLDGQRIADMDAAGIDVQVLSQTAPGPENLPADLAVRLAAEANDRVAQAVAAHPDRFAGFATLPMSDPRAAAGELERAVDELGFVGALINGNIGGRYLDDESFWPVFERAEALGVPIYLHPNIPPQPVVDACYAGFPEAVSLTLATGGWGWHVDTGLHSLRLVIAGVFDRFPRLQIVIGHMGESLPSMIWRADATLGRVVNLARPFKDHFYDHFHITTSGFFDHAPFASALQTFGADRILFSVDYPFSSNTQARAFLDDLPVTPTDRAKIAHANAERLLKLGA